jgi:1,4-dihydroxy-2-naphthoyl-CoA hydrolase
MTIEYAEEGFDRLIGLDITSVDADEVRATLAVTPELLQPYGLLHGGVLCSVVETLGSVGGAAWFGDRGHVVGTSNHTNLLRSARDGAQLQAVATPVHRGRTQQLWSVEVRDQQDRLIAKGELRVANLPAHEASPAQESTARESTARESTARESTAR